MAINKALLNEIWKSLLHQGVRKICDTSTLGGRAMEFGGVKV